MPSDDRSSKSDPGGPRSFATTRWSLVLAAARDSRPDARAALATLCETYWYPLYTYVRRRGYRAEEALDLTQEFFARLLEKESLRVADRARGRFRSFLLASLNHFLANEWDRARSQKRGGGRKAISLDTAAAESRYALEPSAGLAPEKLFDRRWALTLLERVLADLRRECTRDGKERLFDRLKGYLGGEAPGASYSHVGAELGMTEGAVKMAVHRLRRQYRRLLRAQIAQTVASPEEIDDEIRQLFAALDTDSA
ncbi:MAG: sigma-70 family RNA polymerase sigma factor [Planctomycetota bacterium]|nr:sigma-70 family RNA polymerase sigma factor [Planctomycetota bacterium]